MLTRHSEGEVTQSAWRWSDTTASTLDLFSPLREELQKGGWSLIYECEGRSCGGFDFRYSTRVLPEPDMHVDLADFRYLAARRGRGEETEVMSLLVSRSEGARAGFAQMIEVRPSDPALPEGPSVAPQPPAPDPGGIASALDSLGRVVLPGLTFASGGAQLEAHDAEALRAIADWLTAHPGQEVTLVGHSDTSGSAEGNLALSRRRAETTRDLLIQKYGVAAGRVKASGAGHLSPLAPNDTEEGRARNRRVEVVVTRTPFL